MLEILFQRQPALAVPMIALAGTALVFTVWIVFHYWRSVRQAEIDASLKHDMLNRGFLAEDIERVIKASTEESKAEENDPISTNEVVLVQQMILQGHSAEEISRVLNAMHRGNKPAYERHGVKIPY